MAKCPFAHQNRLGGIVAELIEVIGGLGVGDGLGGVLLGGTFGLAATALLAGIEQILAPTLGGDLAVGDTVEVGGFLPWLSHRATSFDHHQCQVGL